MTDIALNEKQSLSLKASITRSYHELFIVFVTSISAAGCLILDQDITLYLQNFLGLSAWTVLLTFLMFESRQVQAQVLIAVAFATVGEYYASIFMEGYTYRLANVPAFVPPGHGMIYLSAVAMGRSEVFKNYYKAFMGCALVGGGLWVVWGLTLASQQDVLGALLFGILLLFLWKGKSAPVYLGAFYITTYLEWVGTLAGTWTWAPIDPIAGLPQGNPPSGVAAWYCLVDAVALSGAPYLLTLVTRIKHWKLVNLLIQIEEWLVHDIKVVLYVLKHYADEKVPQRIPVPVKIKGRH